MPESFRLLESTIRKRRVPLRGRLTRRIAACCINRLIFLAAEDNSVPIVIDINSPGGPLEEALEIVRTIDGLPCPVATFCCGEVGGTAAVVAAHGTPGYRAATPEARFAFTPNGNDHEPSNGNGPNVPEAVAGIVAKDAHREESEVLKWLHEGAQFDPQQAVNLGLIDSVSPTPRIPKPA